MVTSIRMNVTPVPAHWVGAAVWLVAMAVVSAPAQERILLLAPLVIVPALMGELPDRPVGGSTTTHDLAGWPMVLAALPLVGAAASTQGPVAAALTLPWLIITGLIATAGLRDGLRGLPGILGPRRAADVATDAASIALVVGALALTADRADIAFLRFTDVIRTLTAVHFHFAAFGLVGLAALTARTRPGWLPWVAALGLLVGTAVTASGFMLQSTPVNWTGAVLVGLSGLLEAALIARRLRDSAGGVAIVGWLGVAALSVGMLLAIVWATSLVVAPGLLDIDGMVRTHGVLNAFAVTVLVLISRHWSRRGTSP